MLYEVITEFGLDLRACPVYQHQADSEAVEQGNIMHQIGKAVGGDGLAAENQDHVV